MKITKHLFEEDEIAEIRRQYEILTNPCNLSVLKRRETQEEENRNQFQRDYGRIIYSSSFRRLQGKMQILGINPSAFYRNRLTHSLEVCQIATSIATELSKVCKSKDKNDLYVDDLFVIEAAALAHDIGHPAFGHKGERVLDGLAKEYDLRFEGNAQNYRVVRELERKSSKFKGLNLTNRTLLAINKYYKCENKDEKKFMYKEDFNYFENIKKEIVGLENQRTLDVQIIELADDIAYGVHDLEDGLALKIFTLEDVLFKMQNYYNAEKKELNLTKLQCCELFERVIEEAKEDVNSSSFGNKDYYKVFRSNLTSKLIHYILRNLTMRETKHKNVKELQLVPIWKNLLEILKDAVTDCSMNLDTVYLYEMRGEVILKSLFSLFTNEDLNKNGKLFPIEYRPELTKDLAVRKSKVNGDAVKLGISNKKEKLELVRSSLNYLSGMMDIYAIELYEKMFGKKYEDIDVHDLNDINEKLAASKVEVRVVEVNKNIVNLSFNMLKLEND